ncbi:cell wall-binding protein [Clostridiaceae bacterium]|nr:cell wall-binding protein [Clostridiaceae bacterium]
MEEDGTWYFYDSDGNRVEDAWKKSGDNWYWLDSEEGGAMAVDKLVEDDNDTYYVDSNGVMVRNTWVKVVNEDQDEDDDPAEYNYYYMQSNGKAYKAPDNSTTTRFRTIDGKRYAFDDEGKMLYGWVSNGERETDEDGWTNATYYLGSWDDGAMKTGWQKIYVHDDKEDDDLEHWFHFKSNGKKRYNDTTNDIKEEKINGRRYGFDDRGVMTFEWTLATTASTASTSNWRYFNNVDDGARVTKGWFKVVAPHEDNDNVFTSSYGSTTFAYKDADEENERWYYSDGDGKVVSGQIKKIKGKYYGFRPEGAAGDYKAGAMLSGLVLIKVDTATGEILEVLDDGVDSDELDDLMGEDAGSTIWQKYSTTPVSGSQVVSLYYFGSDEDADGAMKTGATTVTLDGSTYHFMFNKTGGAEGKGRGLTGIDDYKYIYKLGCRIKADSDDKYQAVKVTPGVNGALDIHGANVWVEKVKSQDLKTGATTFKNNDNETVSYKDISALQASERKLYYLVNTSGNIQKTKSAAKDGDDWYFYVYKSALKLYANDKNLKEKVPGTRAKWEDYVSDSTTENGK